MYINLDFAKRTFDRFNRTIFECKLPVPSFELAHATTFLGQYKCIRERGRLVHTLRFSSVLQLDERDWEDIVIHEMIHFYIGYFHLKDSTAHGPLFKRFMDEINSSFGRHVTVSRSASSLAAPQPPRTRRKRMMHTVAVLSLTDGRVAIKLLPRVIDSIEYYCTHALRSPQVRSVRTYCSLDDFFEKYPSSKALKMHIIDRKELCAHMADAEELVAKDGDVQFLHRKFEESDLG